jgi:hypothetical protein
MGLVALMEVIIPTTCHVKHRFDELCYAVMRMIFWELGESSSFASCENLPSVCLLCFQLSLLFIARCCLPWEFFLFLRFNLSCTGMGSGVHFLLGPSRSWGWTPFPAYNMIPPGTQGNFKEGASGVGGICFLHWLGASWGLHLSVALSAGLSGPSWYCMAKGWGFYVWETFALDRLVESIVF